MSMNDPLGDMLTRIRNAQMRRRGKVSTPGSSLRQKVLDVLQEKMEEYLANGAQLGWLIDRLERKVYVYRPAEEVTCLEDPAQVSGDPLLPGFVLEMSKVWG